MLILLRSTMLGMIVYYAVTTIPATAIKHNNRIIISIIVVVLYNLLEYLSGFMKSLRRFFCLMLCGCEPNCSGGTVDYGFKVPDLDNIKPKSVLNTSELANEVDETLKLLDEEDAKQASAPAAPAAPAVSATLSEEESGALKATGEAEAEEEVVPAGAEGFVNFGSTIF